MNSSAPDARLIAWERNTDKSKSLMALLPSEMKIEIMSHIITQQSLSSLGQTCRAWHKVANEELYKRDCMENCSFAIKWMAAHAVDEQTTDSALRTLEISRRWGGQIDAVKRRLSRLDRAGSERKDETMYDTSTAIHFAVFLGNVRLTKTLLDMEASLTIPCSPLLFRSMGSEQLILRFKCFRRPLNCYRFGPAFPIVLAFLQSDPGMCRLLMEHGAGREAMIFGYENNAGAMSILHFAAADRTTDYRQWQCLFDRFREYINEPSPDDYQSTPLHVALISGCTQGMQIAVETGADKESRDSGLCTPLRLGIADMPLYTIEDPKPFEEHMRCLRKFVDLGASVNPDGDSLIGFAVKHYASLPEKSPGLRHLIYFLLERHADINRTFFEPHSNMVNEIIHSILELGDAPQSRELLKELLGDLIDRGLNLTIPAPGLPSPLYRVLTHDDSKLVWLVDLLCDNGAPIHEYEVGPAFLSWCETSRLWAGNKYDAWWQHQGQEDEIFLKWCEHPYNAWWWQHVKHISPFFVSQAYQEAFCKSRQLYDILTHLPLPKPWDWDNVLVRLAFCSMQPWSWRLVVLLKFEAKFNDIWCLNCGDNMIHLTVRQFIRVGDYSVADATRDILHLMDEGVEISSRNRHGQTPLDILLGPGSSRDDLMEFAALLEGKMQKVHELA
ncbi:uncharacterized protein CPUR_05656 [Claviceps purpurea 20.1]|uniref:F-box domain-containing protein n=1 Tax=Claviceps purpurea (strain 20.1) TaxID=1111077 RepID=M1W2E1_CLAP2|nr:uncharacterized protein CPUR_05656 [Claviceps purpurea 20.1]